MKKELTLDDFRTLRPLRDDEIKAFDIMLQILKDKGEGYWDLTDTIAECWPGIRESVAKHYEEQGHHILTGKCPSGHIKVKVNK